MNRKRILTLLLIVAMFAAIPAGIAHAALGTGTIQAIAFETDTATPPVTTVLVTIIDETALAQNVSISIDTAIDLNLVIPNAVMIGQLADIPDGLTPPVTVYTGSTVNTLSFVPLAGDPLPSLLAVNFTDSTLVVHDVNLDLETAHTLNLIVIDPAMIGTAIVIDPTLILESTTYTKAVTNLGNFFGPSLGVTFDQLAGYADSGFGYGVISQALWMTTELDGDAALFDQIMAAKSSGDFSTIVLPGGETPDNWGQFRKAVLSDPHQNLGSVMSGKATPLPTEAATTTTTTTTNQGNGNGNGNANGNANDNSNGNNGNANGNANGNNGNGGKK